MSLLSHINELSAKHRAIEQQIQEELTHPGSDDLKISDLKRQKLRIKDEISRLEAELAHH
jgi:hypothetical protein